jgi:hypothetical protein
MKKILLNSLIGIIVLSIGSCKKDSTNTPTGGTSQLFEITINGQTFNETFPPDLVDLSGFNTTTCDNKPGYMINLYDPELNSQYSINSDLQYYHNEVNFKTKGTGSYSLTDGSSFNSCHFSFKLRLYDKSQVNDNTTLLPGGVHTVTSITTVSSSTSKKDVLVEGTYSGTYRNTANSNIVVTGKYKKIIEVLL